MPNRLADRLVGDEDARPFGLRLALVSQEVNQTQRFMFPLWTATASSRRYSKRVERDIRVESITASFEKLQLGLQQSKFISIRVRTVTPVAEPAR